MKQNDIVEKQEKKSIQENLELLQQIKNLKKRVLKTSNMKGIK